MTFAFTTLNLLSLPISKLILIVIEGQNICFFINFFRVKLVQRAPLVQLVHQVLR